LIHFFFRGFPFFLEFQEYFGVIDLRFSIAVLFYPVFVRFEFFENGFGPFWVVPKGRIE
jgi:hypothetical protein